MTAAFRYRGRVRRAHRGRPVGCRRSVTGNAVAARCDPADPRPIGGWLGVEHSRNASPMSAARMNTTYRTSANRPDTEWILLGNHPRKNEKGQWFTVVFHFERHFYQSRKSSHSVATTTREYIFSFLDYFYDFIRLRFQNELVVRRNFWVDSGNKHRPVQFVIIFEYTY